MALRLGDEAPNFTVDSTEGEIRFHDFIDGKWAVLFSHPADYTPVCTTELGRVAQLKDEFAKRNTRVLALSVDPLDSHKGWIGDINETQSTEVNYPILADSDRKVAELYDMLHPNAEAKATVRSVFIIGPDKKIKLTLTYPPSTGRNFDEILRVIDSLQLTADFQVATPADWKQGEDVVVSPAVPDSELESRFPSGVRKVKPYLRYTKQPV
ncbi:peroxiredoxin [Salinispira pacifica]|uniref:Alkyl hydroperoxide reductase subunit C-like protein n=1 Tax=Salinispira pacifica TaxID=1307761 RepID=V5WH35_9SPIO|nr:peroxiredoxin [Salinispira pacifica]AHC14940.1 Alkyl hydroperoxide reductase subunit C-like protein [Salinispira pacifica]